MKKHILHLMVFLVCLSFVSAEAMTFYAGSDDGYVMSEEGTHVQARDATSGLVYDVREFAMIGQWNRDPPLPGMNYYVYRTFLPFDTSSLPDDVMITSATLYFYLERDKTDVDFDLGLVESFQASGSGLVPDDFDNCGDSVSNPTLLASPVNTNGISTSSYTMMALNSVGLNAISKTGYTKLGLRSSRDYSGSGTPPVSPTNEYVHIYTSEASGGSYDPYLEVTYTPCTLKTCTDYPGECGSALDDGCGGTIDCSNACGSAEECVGGVCVDLGDLMSYWAFEDDVQDSVGDNHGTNFGAEFVDGKVDRALEFDGGDYVGGFGDAFDMGTDDFSLEFWFKTSTANAGTIIGKMTTQGSNNPAYVMDVYDGRLRSFLVTAESNYIVNLGFSNVNNGEWHHAVLSIDRNDKAEIYVDGDSKGSVDISSYASESVSNDHDFFIGKRASGVEFTGEIDEIKIYRKALNEEEVQDAYFSASCPNTICDTGENCESCPQDCLEAGQVCCNDVAYEGDCCSDDDCGTGGICYDHQCTSGCIPDCDRKECGDDGCEGTCGECGFNEKCYEGQCILIPSEEYIKTKWRFPLENRGFEINIYESSGNRYDPESNPIFTLKTGTSKPEQKSVFVNEYATSILNPDLSTEKVYVNIQIW